MEDLAYPPLLENNRRKNKERFDRDYREYIERTRAEARNKYRHV